MTVPLESLFCYSQVNYVMGVGSRMQVNKYSSVWYHCKGLILESSFFAVVVTAIRDITIATTSIVTMCPTPVSAKCPQKAETAVNRQTFYWLISGSPGRMLLILPILVDMGIYYRPLHPNSKYLGNPLLCRNFVLWVWVPICFPLKPSV